MGFEKFVRTGKRFTLNVSIWSRGQIGFSNGIVRRFNLDKFDYIVFLFDKDENKIGLRFTTDKDEVGAVKITKREIGSSVGAKSFFDYYSIDYSTTAHYEFEYDKDSDLYVIDLNKIISKKEKKKRKITAWRKQ